MKSKFDLKKISNPHLKPSNLYVGGLTRDEVIEKIGDKKLYKLSSNENLLGASPKALQAIRDHLDEISEYPDRSDNRLRDALSQYFKNELTPDQFVSGNSGSEVLEFISRAFLGPDTEYIVSNPFFKPYEMFSQKLGATMIDIPLDIDNDYELNVVGILNAITPKTRIIFLTSPNNPTGTYIPRETMQRLLDQLPDHIVVVVDEVYSRYADAPDYSESHVFINQGYPVIALHSFSKLFGLAGLRLGYAYSTLEIAEYLRRLYKPFILGTLAIEAGIAALGDDNFLTDTTTLIKTERQRLYPILDDIGIKYWRSQSNFILMRSKGDPLELQEALLQEGIMVRPSAGFGAPGCIRVTIGTREANDAFVTALRKVY